MWVTIAVNTAIEQIQKESGRNISADSSSSSSSSSSSKPISI